MNKRILVAVLLLVGSLTCFARSSDKQMTEPFHFESTRRRLKDNYDKIKELSGKMQNEGKSFYPNTDMRVRYRGEMCSLGQVFPTSTVALTEALNHGMMIDERLADIIKGKDVYANLQRIEGECYHIEEYCNNGIKQLRFSRLYITESLKKTWVSALKRISAYSAEIREQVELIREAL